MAHGGLTQPTLWPAAGASLLWLVGGATLLCLHVFGLKLTLPLGALVALIALLGVPHGALDPVVALGHSLLGPGRTARFALGYLGLAAVTLLAWWLAPGVSLAVFVVLSAWHFAGDWRDALPCWLALLAGSAIILGPAVFHPEGVADAFSALVPGEQARWLVTRMQPIGVVGLALLAIASYRYLRRAPLAIGEVVLLPLLAFALDPLLFFTAYFCLLHSPRHIGRVLRRTQLSVPVIAASGGGILSLTLAGAVGAYFLTAFLEPGDRILRVVFVGLSALTVPHLLLVERVGIWRPAARQAGSRPQQSEQAIAGAVRRHSQSASETRQMPP